MQSLMPVLECACFRPLSSSLCWPQCQTRAVNQDLAADATSAPVWLCCRWSSPTAQPESRGLSFDSSCRSPEEGTRKFQYGRRLDLFRCAVDARGRHGAGLTPLPNRLACGSWFCVHSLQAENQHDRPTIPHPCPGVDLSCTPWMEDYPSPLPWSGSELHALDGGWQLIRLVCPQRR
jgi:hypothetical protein